MGRSNINDIQVGQDTKISIVSYSHGRKRVPLAQSLAFTPKKAVNIVGEFDDRYPVLTYETYEGVDVNFETLQADQIDLDAMIMDQDPNSAVINMDPANNGQVNIYCNYFGRNTAYQYGGEYAERCRLSGQPNTHSLKDATKRNQTFMGTRYFRIEGKTGFKAAIQYTRFVNVPAFVTADDVAMTGSTGVFPNQPFPFPLAPTANNGVIGGTQNYIAAFKNGLPINGNANLGATDFTISVNTMTTAVPTVAGDVIEVYTVCSPANPIS